MKQQEKELLIKDLCARLPYGVKAQLDGNEIPINLLVEGYNNNCIINDNEFWAINDLKLYLFPMSSMTEEQVDEIDNYNIVKQIDWLNAHHFDYRNLIDKKLAIDATGLNVY